MGTKTFESTIDSYCYLPLTSMDHGGLVKKIKGEDSVARETQKVKGIKLGNLYQGLNSAQIGWPAAGYRYL